MDKNSLWFAATITAYILGIATGILVVKDCMEQKYKSIAQEEIDSVKKAFSKRKKTEPVPKEKSADDMQKDVKHFLEPCKKYMISPDEFGELPDYDTITLTYFADGIIADENDEPLDIDIVVAMIGTNSLNYFTGKHDADAVYVRDDAKKCDYEILFDERDYSQISDNMPPM